MSADLETLEQTLEHQFANRDLLVRALTHKSYRFEKPAPSTDDVLADNEQLEFLGDSILGFVISEFLIQRYPTLPEGGLSKRKAHLVSAQHLHEAAERLNLGDYLLLGRGEELSGGRKKRALLANALEALIAALYLDGGINVTRHLILAYVVAGRDLGSETNGDTLNDYKSALQERTQALQLPTPRYSIVREHGPEHSKIFTVEVRVGREYSSRAEGYSKKSAGQKAAQLVLEQLRTM